MGYHPQISDNQKTTIAENQSVQIIHFAHFCVEFSGIASSITAAAAVTVVVEVK